MTQAPVSSPQVMDGYDAPQVFQFSVFLDNRVGKMLSLLKMFRDKPFHLAGMTVLDSADHAVVRLVTSNHASTKRALTENHVPFTLVEIMAVELPQPQGMDTMCACLLGAEVSLHYAYPLMVQPHGMPVIALYTDEQMTSSQVLQRHGFVLLGEADLGE